MDRSTAGVLIQWHRRLWRSQDSDGVVVNRAERTYMALAILHAGMAAAFVALLHGAGVLQGVGLPVAFLVAGVIYFWQSRRFAQIRWHMSDLLGVPPAD